MVNEIISSNKLRKCLNMNVQSLLIEGSYDIKQINPRDLLTSLRVDLIAKYLYAKFIKEKIDSDYAENLYLEHIKLFNNFVEKDESMKVGKKAFLSSFKDLINSMTEFDFDMEKIIPVNQDNLILDGAHRTATAMCLGKTVPIVKIDYSEPSFKFDYQFFQEKGLSSDYLDRLALEYARLKPNTNIILVWPRAAGYDKELRGILSENGKIVYEKQIEISSEGLVNLMTNVYKNEPWLGNYTNDFSGARTKAQMCYAGNNKLRVFLFESSADLIVMKDQIRNIFKVEKHALHINDTHKETIEIAQILFNKNSLHNINSSKLKNLKHFNTLFNSYIKWIEDNSVDPENFALIGGVLAAYGVKESSDLDFISTDTNVPQNITSQIEKEENKIKYTSLKIDDIIHNPDNYFYYRNVKFVALPVIKEIKEKRGNLNDKDDIEYVNALLKDGVIKGSPFDKFRKLLQINFYKRNIKIFLLKLRFYFYLIRKKVKS